MSLLRHLQKPRRRGPRRPRTRLHAEHTARADGRAQRRRLEPLRGKVADRHRAPAQQVVQPLAPQPTELSAGLQQFPELARRRRVDRRGHLSQHRAHRGGQRLCAGHKGRPSLGVARRPRRQSSRGRDGLARKYQCPAVACGHAHRYGGPHEVQALPVQAEVAHHICAQGDRMGQCGHTHAGREFVRDGTPAHLVACFEHQRAEPCLGQVRRAHQPVVAGADDDRAAHDFPSTDSAAFRPGAPMIPPPGCVAEPHM